jgi:hypothetical protein
MQAGASPIARSQIYVWNNHLPAHLVDGRLVLQLVSELVERPRAEPRP